MTTQVIEIGTQGTFGSRAAFGSGRRRRSSGPADRRLLAAFQAGLIIVLLALGLLSMMTIGSASAADATPKHGPVPGLGL